MVCCVVCWDTKEKKKRNLSQILHPSFHSPQYIFNSSSTEEDSRESGTQWGQKGRKGGEGKKNWTKKGGEGSKEGKNEESERKEGKREGRKEGGREEGKEARKNIP